MSDKPESNKGVETPSGFNPNFALPTRELLSHYGRLATFSLEREDAIRIAQNLSSLLDVKVDDISGEELKGYKSIEDQILISGNFKEGYYQLESELERTDYSIKMIKRDQFVQFLTRYYALVKFYKENLKDPEIYNFESGEEAYRFFELFENCVNENENCAKFQAEISFFIKQNQPDETDKVQGETDEEQDETDEVQDETDEVQDKAAYYAMLNFYFFNELFKADKNKRREVLEGLATSPDRILDIDLTDENSVNSLLNDEQKRIRQAKNIADFFCHFNARPYAIITYGK